MAIIFCDFSVGILVVVAIGVALGVVIGGILLSLVAYYMKRCDVGLEVGYLGRVFQ